LERLLIRRFSRTGKRLAGQHRRRVNNVVGARPEVVVDEAIPSHRPATEDERTDTAQMATATLNPTAARLQGGGDGVAAADAFQNTDTSCPTCRSSLQ
jgi:hypothetical protein